MVRYIDMRLERAFSTFSFEVHKVLCRGHQRYPVTVSFVARQMTLELLLAMGEKEFIKLFVYDEGGFVDREKCLL